MTTRGVRQKHAQGVEMSIDDQDYGKGRKSSWTQAQCDAMSDALFKKAGIKFVSEEDAFAILQERIASLEQEIENYKRDRAEVVKYLDAVAQCSRMHPDGYTLVDFQQVWLEQERDKNEKLEQENAALKASLEEYHGIHVGELKGGCCDHGCLIDPPKVGTNGGKCYCSQGKVRRYIQGLRAELAHFKAAFDDDRYPDDLHEWLNPVQAQDLRSKLERAEKALKSLSDKQNYPWFKQVVRRYFEERDKI